MNVVVEKHVYDELQKHISSFSVQLLFIYRDERREVTEKGFIQIRLREEKVSFPDGQPP